MNTKISGLLRPYMDNLQLFLGEADSFACPLCRQIFTSAQSDQLSIEHIIPQSVGGTDLTLTCKSCNNTFGSTIDSFLSGQLRAQQFLSGDLESSVRHTIFTATGKAAATVSISTDDDSLNVSIELLKQFSDPAQYQNLREDLSGTVAQVGADFTVREKVDVINARIALLKSAYLKMFHHFGYGYICQIEAIPIHMQLSNIGSELLPLKKMIRRISIEEYRDGIGIVCKPATLGSFIVPLQLVLNNVEYCFVVFLPKPMHEISEFPTWKSNFDAASDTELITHFFEIDPLSIGDAAKYISHRAIWNEANK